MPELPEVETTRRGLAPHVVGRRVTAVVVRESRLRWPVPTPLARELSGQTVTALARRAKYLLLQCDAGTAIIHLGMSGSLRVVAADTPPGKHAHVDIVLDDGRCLRYNDPRRFGSLLWTREDPATHPLLVELGPEPLGETFTAKTLFDASRDRRVAVKPFVMDSHTVVGVGNIYASEALYLAGIHPRRAAGRISLPRYERLVACIRQVLDEAIAQGGTTLRDFTGGDGKPGYFKQYLRVYGRAGEPCRDCATPIRQVRLGQRSTFFCPHCQR